MKLFSLILFKKIFPSIFYPKLKIIIKVEIVKTKLEKVLMDKLN